jgi:HEAT repeat protein
MQTRTLLAFMAGLVLGGVALGEQAEGRKLPSRPMGQKKPLPVRQGNNVGLPPLLVRPLPPLGAAPGPVFWEFWASVVWEAVEKYWPEWRNCARPLTPALLELLRRAKEPSVRQFAARALGEIGPPGVGLADEKEPLVAGLLRALEKDKDGEVRVEALAALRRTARPSVPILRALGRALRDAAVDVERLAASCLEGRKADVMPALRVAFSGETPCVNHNAIQLAGRLGPKARPLAPALLDLLWQDDDNAKELAARALLEIDHRTFGPAVDAMFARAIRNALQDGSRAPNIRLLWPYRPQGALPRTVALLGKMLKGSPRQRHWALQVAGILGPDALPLSSAVEGALKDKGLTAPVSAACALIGMGRPEEARAYWLRGRGLQDNTHETCFMLALCGPAPSYVVRLIREEMGRAAGRNRIELARCLWNIGGKSVGRVRTLDTRQCGLDVLISSLKSDDWRDRELAIEAITEIGPEAARAVPALIRRLQDKKGTPEERLAVAQALGAIGPAAGPAEKWLRRLCKDPSPSIQHEAACALHRIRPGHPLALATLQKLIRAEDTPGIPFAVEFLGEMGKHARPAAPLLVPLLRHANLAVSSLASAVLWKVDPALARKVGAW